MRAYVVGVVSALVSRWSSFRARVASIIGAIRSVFSNVFGRLRSIAGTALGAILNPVQGVKTAFDAVSSAIRGVIGWIRNIRWPKPPAWLSKVGGAIGGIFTRSAPAPAGRSLLGARTMRAALTAPRMAAATTAATGVPRLSRSVRASVASGDTYMITVAGGLDSADTIARRIEKLLADRQRRTTGRVVAGA